MEEMIIKAISELNEVKVTKLVNDCLKNKVNPIRIVAALEKGMERIGQLYEQNEYYITDLIMAGILFKEVLGMEGMIGAVHSNSKNKFIGRMVIGTVEADVHDIGKNIVIGLAESVGFEVFDLGVNVDSQMFCNKVRELKPDILGMSGILTLAIDNMKKTIDQLENQNLRNNLKVIIGGNMLTESSFQYTGADSFTKDANKGVQICKDWVRNLHMKE